MSALSKKAIEAIIARRMSTSGKYRSGRGANKRLDHKVSDILLLPSIPEKFPPQVTDPESDAFGAPVFMLDGADFAP